MDIVLRAAFLFFFVFLLMRTLGRRELANLEPFDVILLVVTGDLIQQGITQSDYSVSAAVLALSTFGALTVLTSYASFRSRRMRIVLEGEPIIVVEDGRMIEANLRRERITQEELREAMRQQGIGSLSRVRWGVLETSGQITFITHEAA